MIADVFDNLEVRLQRFDGSCLHGGSKLSNVVIAVDSDAQHFAFEHQLVFNETLKSKLSQLASSHASYLRNQIETTSGKNWFAKSDGVHTTEAKVVAADEVVLASIETAQLRGSFALNDARHQWESGHVAGRPEFLVCDVLKPNDHVGIFVNMNDAAELFHFVTLGIDSANVIKRKQWFVEVKLTHVNKWFGRHGLRFFLDVECVRL